MNNITKRLTDDTNYKKTGKSLQQTLSPDEIKDKLQEYIQLGTIDEAQINNHIRYFTIDKKTGKKQILRATRGDVAADGQSRIASAPVRDV